MNNTASKLPGGVVTKILSVFLSIILYSDSKAQSIFTPVDTSVTPLNGAQREVYNKARAFGTYYKYQFVHVGSLAAAHQDSTLTMKLSDLECHDSIRFLTHNIEYSMDTSFYWYGQIHYEDSASHCYNGEAMLFTYGGQYYGYIMANDRNFEIIDLTGGVQLIARVDLSDTTRNRCPTNPDVTSRITASEPTGGYQCSPKILIVFTAAAFNADPMAWARGQLSFNQTRQAVFNSQVSTFKMNFDLVAMRVAYNYTEDVYNSSAPVPNNTGVGGDLLNMHNTSIPLGSAIANWQATLHPDITVLLVKNAALDRNGGIAWQNDPPAYFYAHAAAQIGYATTAGYTFAHEVGHVMGTRHSPTDDPTASLAHAHEWYYTTTTGIWPFKKNHSNWGHTLTYENSAGRTDVVLAWSNPNQSSNGQPRGVMYTKDAAQYLNYNGCLIANYDDYPDNFNAVIEPTNRPQRSTGHYMFCYGNSYTITAYVVGPPGTYSYAWEYSGNGINWTPIAGTTSPTTTFSPYFTGFFYYRVHITSPTPQSITRYYMLYARGCPPGVYRTSPQNPITELVSVAPNPAHEHIDVRFSLSTAGKVAISLIDMNGKLINDIYTGTATEGTQEIRVNTSNLAGGIYQLRFVTADKTEVRKVLVQQ